MVPKLPKNSNKILVFTAQYLFLKVFGKIYLWISYLIFPRCNKENRIKEKDRPKRKKERKGDLRGTERFREE